MAKFSDIGKFFLFIATGLIAIVVGSFMLRGNMHMWDRKSNDPKDNKENEDK